jgi:CubicO group peptidase (beta-lactamase class C family)
LPDFGHGDRFGYGFGVVANRGDRPEEVGTYSWAGFFSTYFWVDPKNELFGIILTQSYPSGAPTLSDDFKRLTYEARIDGR